MEGSRGPRDGGGGQRPNLQADPDQAAGVGAGVWGAAKEGVRAPKGEAPRTPIPQPVPADLLPAWAQKGTVPSLCTRCGPLKLYLYSKRRCGSAGWGAPVAAGFAGSPPTPTQRLSASTRAPRSGQAPALETLGLDAAILGSGTRRPEGGEELGSRGRPTGRSLIGRAGGITCEGKG